jgi:hypothetical protein
MNALAVLAAFGRFDCGGFSTYYEPTIWQKGRVPTRIRNARKVWIAKRVARAENRKATR